MLATTGFHGKFQFIVDEKAEMVHMTVLDKTALAM